MIVLILSFGKGWDRKGFLRPWLRWWKIIISGGGMGFYQDFEDLLHFLNAVGARYLLVGAHAVSYYTEPRYTKDLDILIDPTKENAAKVYDALKLFKAPLGNLRERDLTNPDLVYQMGIAPVRIDVIMGIKGLDFTKAWKKREKGIFVKEEVFIIGLEDLIEAKKRASRDQDKIDLKKLLKAARMLKKKKRK